MSTSSTAASDARTTAFPHLAAKRIAVTGATGLVGSALVPLFTAAGHEVVRITRRPGAPGERVRDLGWDPDAGQLDAGALEGVDAVVHLAGAPVSERWTESHKREIRDSRVQGTSLLARTLARLVRKPAAFVSTSAIGYYGDGGDRILTEDSPPGDDFLGRVGQEWEAATRPAEDAGIRTVHARLGVVLSPHGGALAKLLPPFRLGGGGKIADGQQWQSWIALDDAVGAYEHLAFTEAARGPYNVAAPAPVRNEEFSDVLAHVLGRPALVTVPAFALRLLFGEMADAMLLAGQRVLVDRLLATGFTFRHPRLEQALRFELARE